MATTRSRAIPIMGRAKGFLTTVSVTIPWRILSKSTQSFAFNPKGLQGTQVTVSEYHPGWRRSMRATSDVGGNFFTQKKYAYWNPRIESIQATQVTQTNPTTGQPTAWQDVSYEGPVLPWNLTGVSFPPANTGSISSLEAMGASAIARVKPTNSTSDLSVFLGELYREGIPKLLGAQTWKDRSLKARNAGREYLNVEFGWKPLIGEIRSLADSLRRADAVIKQYQRDAGRVVRRRYEFPSETSVETTTFRSGVSAYYAPSSGVLTDASTSNQGKVIRTRTTERRVWFSGAFTYYIPDYLGGLGRASAEAKKLLGLGLTPDTLWNLSPWSWAVDWFSNAGDVISNISDMASDGLVMRYGYIMEHVIVRDVYSFVGPTGLKGGGSIVPTDVVLVTETKTRRRANPYGFGISWDSLTNRQIAILTALGISRRG